MLWLTAIAVTLSQIGVHQGNEAMKIIGCTLALISVALYVRINT